ncbi:phosphate butyryltransferase [candidate division GN15 bacterium]|uniref:Phosphate butyryltransferase n=1 Tax=candidate division GN15 bacterium TaxID=2072418 RepID=A0A855WT07_9BACT|nr:MAG: phosphate butyryltransferase [candidate division GN15 bacterium]
MSNLPEITIPAVNSYTHIFERAKTKTASRPVRAALIGPIDPDMLGAFARAVADRLIEPTIIGDRKALEQALAEHNFKLTPAHMVDVADTESAVRRVVEMAANKEIDLIIKGRVVTADLLSLLFAADANYLKADKTVSHVAVIKPEKYPKLLLVTDAGVTIEPDLKAKLSLIQNLLGVAKAVGIDNPRLAILAAVEVVYPTMPVTMEAAIISKMAERGQIKGAYIDGPLSFDVSVDMFAAHSKGVKTSQVAGQADAMLAPNLETANGIYKAMTLFGRCEMGGVIVGGRVPVAVASRSDSPQGKYNSILLGVLTA